MKFNNASDENDFYNSRWCGREKWNLVAYAEKVADVLEVILAKGGKIDLFFSSLQTRFATIVFQTFPIPEQGISPAGEQYLVNLLRRYWAHWPQVGGFDGEESRDSRPETAR